MCELLRHTLRKSIAIHANILECTDTVTSTVHTTRSRSLDFGVWFYTRGARRPVTCVRRVAPADEYYMTISEICEKWHRCAKDFHLIP